MNYIYPELTLTEDILDLFPGYFSIIEKTEQGYKYNQVNTNLAKLFHLDKTNFKNMLVGKVHLLSDVVFNPQYISEKNEYNIIEYLNTLFELKTFDKTIEIHLYDTTISILVKGVVIHFNNADYALLFGVNTTDIDSYEAKLFRYEERLKWFFEQTPLAIIEFNLHFEITQWNNAAENIFGFKREEVIGKNPLDFLSDQDSSLERMMIDLLSGNNFSKAVFKHTTKEGEHIICEWYTTVLTDKSNIQFVSVASIVRDITEVYKVNSKLLLLDNLTKALTESSTHQQALYRLLVNLNSYITNPQSFNSFVPLGHTSVFSEAWLVKDNLNPSFEFCVNDHKGFTDINIDLINQISKNQKFSDSECLLSNVLTLKKPHTLDIFVCSFFNKHSVYKFINSKYVTFIPLISSSSCVAILVYYTSMPLDPDVITTISEIYQIANIIEFKIIEEKLVSSEARYKSLLESFPALLDSYNTKTNTAIATNTIDKLISKPLDNTEREIVIRNLESNIEKINKVLFYNGQGIQSKIYVIENSLQEARHDIEEVKACNKEIQSKVDTIGDANLVKLIKKITWTRFLQLTTLFFFLLYILDSTNSLVYVSKHTPLKSIIDRIEKIIFK